MEGEWEPSELPRGAVQAHQPQCGVSHIYPQRRKGTCLLCVVHATTTKEKHKRKTQKKKRPGCSLPAGSFLFGAYRIIRPTPTGTASTAATTPSIANPASGCW